MEGQNYSVKERLEQLEALMGKYTAGGKDQQSLGVFTR